MNRSASKKSNPFRLRWTRILMLSALLSAVGFAGATEYYSRTMNKPDPVSNQNRETSDAKPEMENRKIVFRHIQPITLFSRVAHYFTARHHLGIYYCGERECDFFRMFLIVPRTLPPCGMDLIIAHESGF